MLHLAILHQYFASFISLAFKNEQDFFAELEKRETEFGISDIQLSLTTLEEVFLNIAKQAELESAAAEGRLVALNLPSGVSLQVNHMFLSSSSIIHILESDYNHVLSYLLTNNAGTCWSKVRRYSRDRIR